MMKTLYHFLFGTLRGRLIIGVAAVHAVMMALFIGDLTAHQRAMLMDRQIEVATALSQSLATSAAGWIAADDIAGLQELVEVQRRYPEIIFAILADKEGRVLAHTDKSRQGLYMPDLPSEAHQTVISRTPALVDVAAPAMIGGRHVGWTRVGVGQKAAGEKLAKITMSGVVYALAAIIIGSVIAWFMGRRITRRLYAIHETIDAVRTGNSLSRSSLVGTDEAAVMAREFNSMLDALAERDTELRASEERYRSLIRKVRTAIVIHDRHGRLINSNPLAQELLGLSADQLLGKSLIDPEWHFLREDGSVLPVAEYPVSLVISSQQPLRGHVTGISRPDRDDVVWVMVNAEPEYDDAGEISLIIVSFADITERKRAEEALRESEEKYRTLFEESFDGIFITSPGGKILDMNKKGIMMFGYDTKQEILSLDLEQDVYAYPPDRKRILDMINALGSAEYEVIVKKKSGETMITHCSLTAVKDQKGMITTYRGIIRDITERKRAEEEIRKLNQELEQRVIERTAQLEAVNKELETFAYSVSHDLRAPLRHIDGFLELLQKRTATTPDEQSRHYMDTISESAKHMGTLIDDLLSFSRMGRNRMSEQRVDLGELTQEVIRDFEPEIGNRKIHWHVCDLPVVNGDRAMLRMVLVNLISNALKFSQLRQQAEIEIGRIRTQETETIVFVRDNGVGFDMNYADRLFGVFQRLHRADEFEGTGIGLANVRRIINRHGGRTWAEGQVNQGSTFYFSLPQVIEET